MLDHTRASERNSLAALGLSLVGGGLGGALGNTIGLIFITRVVFPDTPLDGTVVAFFIGAVVGGFCGLLSWALTRSRIVACFTAFVAALTSIILAIYLLREMARAG